MHGTIYAANDTIQHAAHEPAPELFRAVTHWPYFERRLRWKSRCILQRHYVRLVMLITKYNNIVDIEKARRCSRRHLRSAAAIRDVAPARRRESFIPMDRPRHSAQRKTVGQRSRPIDLAQLANQHPQALRRMRGQFVFKRCVRLVGRVRI